MVMLRFAINLTDIEEGDDRYRSSVPATLTDSHHA